MDTLTTVPEKELKPHPDMQLCLASGSLQRQALLAQLGLISLVLPMDIDERRRSGEGAEHYVHRLALEKARQARTVLRARCGGAHSPASSDATDRTTVTTDRATTLPVLGADTTVLLGQRVMEKPEDEDHAKEMLQCLSGHKHQVFTAAGIVGCTGENSIIVETTVTLRRLSRQDIAAYIASGEPFGKAGGYAIQGLGAVFIERIEGSYSNVMGLPLFETAALLKRAGIDVMNADAMKSKKNG